LFTFYHHFMSRLLFLLLLPYTLLQSVSAQTLQVSPASVAFPATRTGTTDSMLVTFSLAGNYDSRDSSVSITAISSPCGSFTVRNTQHTVTTSSTASAWVYFTPRHNITERCYLVISATGPKASTALAVTGTGTYNDPYYETTQNLSEEALKTALKTIVTNGHSALGYNGARDRMFMTIDNKRTNGQQASVNTLECVYTGRLVTGYTSRTDAQNNGNLNTEHTWPQSLFNENEPMKSDLHHLFVTDNPANSTRSNYRFGVVSNPSWTQGGSKYGNSIFEPRDSHKGAAARAMLYFAVRYQNYSSFLNAQEGILREWHNTFAPTAAEQRRNEDVNTAQGNRNPFIDHPEFLERITSISSTSAAPVRTTVAYSAEPVSIRTHFNAQEQQPACSYAIANTGNTSINYTVSFVLGRFILKTGGGIMAPDSMAVIGFTPPAGAGIVTDTLIIASNATNAPEIRVPVSAETILASGTGEAAGSPFTFQLFPNPSNHELNILSQITGRYAVSVITLQGQELISREGNEGITTISTTALPDGIYIVTIQNNRSVQRYRLAVRH
jgi:deoxyribonuclease-1